jgi:polar amino acid transport system permease protein
MAGMMSLLKRALILPERQETAGRFQHWFNLLLVISTAIGLGYLALERASLSWQWNLLTPYWRLYVEGWRTTIALSVSALVTSAFIGLALALLRRSRFVALRYAAASTVEIVRGTPLLVQIYILFYIVAEAVHLENRFVAGTITLSLFSGAYISEILRAGIEGVGKSQIESAKAIGLTKLQTYRHVIFPQALRASLPALAGQFVSLVKDSSLLSIIGLNELTQNARNVASFTFSNFESYLLLAAGYCACTLPLSLWARRLETRMRYET